MREPPPPSSTAAGAFQRSPLKEECVARALYSNEADYPGELSFAKDDVLRVISRKPEIEGCSEGWWLCVDKNGKRGIAPGNRLEVMHRFDDAFFRVAQPLMDDFFAFHGSPFEDPFFRNGRAQFSNSLRERMFDQQPMRRMNSCDDALKNVGVVRNIPIRVEKGNAERMCHSQVNIPDHIPSARRHSDFPSEFRRMQFETNGRVSPPPQQPRRPSLVSQEERPQRVVSSDEEERRSVRSERSPQRTLVLPGVNGRTIEIPLGEPMLRPPGMDRERSKSPKPESQLDKLTQRLRNIAARPFRSEKIQHQHQELPKETKDDRSPSPSSSGIGADLTDSSHSGEENKRTSDLSSLSGSEQNGFPPIDEEGSMSRQQPYLGRLVPQQPPTSVLQAVFNGLEHHPRTPTDSRLNVEEDMRRNETLPWNHVPTTIVGGRGVGDVLEEEIHARKRVVCNKMSECLRSIDGAVAQIHRVTAPQHWRVAHVLQGNLNSLRDAAITVTESLEHFVDSTGRISIDRTNPKSIEFSRLLQPLIDSKRLLSGLKKAQDQGGWTVATLSRDREQTRSMDNLEQFVSVAGQVPADCRLLLQWVHVLVPSSTVIFLSPIAKPQNTMAARPVPIERPHQFLVPSLPQNQEEKRLSSSSTSSNAASLDTPPSSILITKPNLDKPRGRVTFADEAGDRTSTSSSGDNSSLEYASIQKPSRPLEDNRILEEDDLESVVSDRDSLFQDYAYLDDVVPGRSTAPAPRVNDEDRQLVRFYAPQLEQHTEALSAAIEEFLGTVEQHLPPREFVQKGKLIILAAHKLIYIGDSVSQCVRDRSVSRALRDCADQLCELLKDCVKATKTAADEFPEIKSMQSMVDAIIAVSKAAHRLKLMISECC